MKTQEHQHEDPEHSRYEADLGASINALFVRCPRLHGFAVRSTAPSGDGFALPPAGELFVTDVSIYPSCGFETAVTHFGAIATALARLIDECPEAGELLRERTFARVLH
jgi:antirestriction protein